MAILPQDGNSDRRVLVVGGDGVIGAAFVGYLRGCGVGVVPTTRRRTGEGVHLDLAQVPADWQLPEGVTEVVICAAVSRLQDAEKMPAESLSRINVEGPLAIAEAAARAGAPVLFLSTNHVRVGRQAQLGVDEPYEPINAYGRSKAEAEQALLAALGDRVAILRLSKVLSPSEALLTQWSCRMREGQELRPFEDMMVAPVALDDCLRLMDAILTSGEGGIWQFSGARDVSYYELAQVLADALGVSHERIRPQATPAALRSVGIARQSTMNATRALALVPDLRLELRSLAEWFVAVSSEALQGA